MYLSNEFFFFSLQEYILLNLLSWRVLKRQEKILKDIITCLLLSVSTRQDFTFYLISEGKNGV
jgi:hypothetical protein